MRLFFEGISHRFSIVAHATAWRRELKLYTSDRPGQPLQFRAKNSSSHVIIAYMTHVFGCIKCGDMHVIYDRYSTDIKPGVNPCNAVFHFKMANQWILLVKSIDIKFSSYSLETLRPAPISICLVKACSSFRFKNLNWTPRVFVFLNHRWYD